MEASIQLWRNGQRSDDIFRFRLGRLRRNSKIIKRRRGTALQSHPESIHTQAKSSAEAELYAAALGASESNGMVLLLKDLGYEMKPVLAVDAKATDTLMWHSCGILVDAEEVASAQSQEQGKQRSNCETLPHIVVCQHGRRKC